MDPTRPRITTEELPPDNYPSPQTELRQETNFQKNIRPNPKFSRYFFLIPALLILLTIFLVGFISSRLFNRQKTQVPMSYSLPPALSPATPIPTLRPVLKNKLFLSNSFEISFEYPEDVSLLECEEEIFFYRPRNEEATCNKPGSYLVTLKYSSFNFYPRIDFEKNPDETITKIDDEEAVIQALKNDPPQISVTFSKDKKYFLIETKESQGKSLIDALLETLKFNKDITKNWEEYTNKRFGFSFKYPENWQIASKSDVKLVVKKDINEEKFQTLTIESQEVNQASLTAQEFISSTRSLAGWKITPSVDLRNFGGGTAYILKGQFNGYWHSFVVIWYKNKIIQILWYDDLSRENEQIFESVLNSLRFFTPTLS